MDAKRGRSASAQGRGLAARLRRAIWLRAPAPPAPLRLLPPDPGGPLFGWSAARRAALARRRRAIRQGACTVLFAGVIASTALAPPHPRLVWNASASMKIGLYWLTPGTPAGMGETVVARLPEGLRKLAAERRYLPANVPLVKRVAAMPGDEVCALGPALFRNGKPLVARVRSDSRGRRLPWWEGCRRLREGERLLLLADNPASFDGRYFGVSVPGDILGRARLLWPR